MRRLSFITIAESARGVDGGAQLSSVTGGTRIDDAIDERVAEQSKLPSRVTRQIHSIPSVKLESRTS